MDYDKEIEKLEGQLKALKQHTLNVWELLNI